jgi:extracellular elastinolytic metalloproteinase
LAYQFQLRNEAGTKWLQVSVDSTTGKIVQVVDYVSNASYKALSLPKVDPKESFAVENFPTYGLSSPQGWHYADESSGIMKETQGNNAHSGIGGKTTQGTTNLDFTHEWDPTQNPTETEGNRRAANSEFNVFT